MLIKIDGLCEGGGGAVYVLCGQIDPPPKPTEAVAGKFFFLFSLPLCMDRDQDPMLVKLRRLPITSPITTNSNNGERKWPTSACASHKSVGMSHLADNLHGNTTSTTAEYGVLCAYSVCCMNAFYSWLVSTCCQLAMRGQKSNTSNSKNEGMRSVMDSLTDKV